MGDKKIVNRIFLRGLVAVFPLSIISFFFLDGALSFIFTEYWLVPPTNVLVWVIFFTILRTVFAEWVVSAVVGFCAPRSPSRRIESLFVALVLYGIPMMTVCEPVRSPLSLFIMPIIKWIGDVLNVIYMPFPVAVVVTFIYMPLLLDFSRLAPYLYIKRWIHSRTGDAGEKITPMPPKKVILIYLLAIIVLFLLDAIILPLVPRLDIFSVSGSSLIAGLLAHS
jgi:hypothetical protein